MAQSSNRKLLRTFGSQPLMGDFLKADYELAYRDLLTRRGRRQPASTDQAAGRVKLQGRWAQSFYKAEWGYFGQDFHSEEVTTPQDQSGGKVSWSWKLPHLEPRIAWSNLSNNVKFNPSHPRRTTSEQAVSLRWNPPELPTLIMSYGREHTKTHTTSESTPHLTRTTNKASGKLRYEQPTWSAFLQSFFSTKNDQVSHTIGTQSLGYSIGGKFSPFHAIHISPTVGYRHESQNASNLRTQFFSAQVRSSYQIATFVSLTPDVRYHYRTDNVQNLQAKSFSAMLLSQFTPNDQPLRLSFLGKFNASNGSTRTALQSLKLALGLDNLLLECFNVQPYKKNYGS